MPYRNNFSDDIKTNDIKTNDTSKEMVVSQKRDKPGPADIVIKSYISGVGAKTEDLINALNMVDHNSAKLSEKSITYLELSSWIVLPQVYLVLELTQTFRTHYHSIF